MLQKGIVMCVITAPTILDFFGHFFAKAISAQWKQATVRKWLVLIINIENIFWAYSKQVFELLMLLYVVAILKNCF